jgi:hypothetical protein
MSIEAMKQALEALEEVQGHMNTSDWFNERVDTLRTTIEQAEKQEPVAWGVHDQIALNKAIASYPAPAAPNVATPLVQEDECVVCGDKVRVIPRPWVGLTDEEIKSATDHIEPQHGLYWVLAKAIEAKLKEKNT